MQRGCGRYNIMVEQWSRGKSQVIRNFNSIHYIRDVGERTWYICYHRDRTSINRSSALSSSRTPLEISIQYITSRMWENEHDTSCYHHDRTLINRSSALSSFPHSTGKTSSVERTQIWNILQCRASVISILFVALSLYFPWQSAVWSYYSENHKNLLHFPQHKRARQKEYKVGPHCKKVWPSSFF